MNAQVPSRGGLMVLFAFGAVLATIVVLLQFPLPDQRRLLAEGGPFETLSAVGYIGCVVLMVGLWGLSATLQRWYFAVVLFLFAARELDLDKRPFTEGLLKSRQYIGDTVPAAERAISALILIAIIISIAMLLFREVRQFTHGLMRRSPTAFAVLAGVLFIVGTKTIDGLARKLAPFGVELSDNLNQTLTVQEEVGEMGIPIMFAIAIYLSASRMKARQ